jgi:hypothetical protein
MAVTVIIAAYQSATRGTCALLDSEAHIQIAARYIESDREIVVLFGLVRRSANNQLKYLLHLRLTSR